MRYIQHPVTHKLIPAEEYERQGPKTSAVIDDISPFVSTVDGTVIGSRSALREHNRRHGVVTAAEYGGVVDQAAQKRRHDHYQGKRSRAAELERKQQINEVINHLERQQ